MSRPPRPGSAADRAGRLAPVSGSGAALRREEGDRLAARGEYAAALAEFAAAAALDPSDVMAWRQKAVLEQNLGEEPESRRSLAAALAAQRRRARADASPEAILELADLLEENGRPQEASSVLARAAARAPRDAALARESARLRLWAGRLADAERLAGRVLAESPGDFEARRTRAGAAFLRGRRAEALREFEALAAERPGDLETRTWRGEALLAAGRAAEALVEFEAVMSRTDGHVAADLGQARALAALGRRAQPFDLWVVACQLPPGRRPRGLEKAPLARVEKALAAALPSLGGNRSKEKTSAARGVLRAYAPVETAYDRCEKLQARLRRGDPEAALAGFARMEAAEPREPQVHSFRAELLCWLGRYAEADAGFRRAHELDPSLRWPHIGRAGVAVLTGRGEDALRHLDAGIAAGARDRTWRAWRGEALLGLGRTKEALAELRVAVEAQPRRYAAWLLLSRALAACGEEDEAARIFAAARAWAPAFMAEAGAPRGDLSAAEREAALTKALALMRGNRSSWLYCWHDAAGKVRNLPVGFDWSLLEKA